jgi:hypothetical protein
VRERKKTKLDAKFFEWEEREREREKTETQASKTNVSN